MVAAAAAEGSYALGLHDGHVASNAATVLQPVMLLWSCAAIGGLFVAGAWWADHRRAGSRADRALAIGSDRSFGVFLVHPGVLWLLMQGQSRWVTGLHGLPLTVAAYALVVAGSLALTELFRRSPLSLALTGRNRMRPRPEAAPAHDRKDIPDVPHESDPARAPVEAPHQGHHDDDRRWPADALLR
jgi:peptidoglycan/LPS O-acetylase OafA/YrhL